MRPSSSIPDKKFDLVEAWLNKIGPNLKQEMDSSLQTYWKTYVRKSWKIRQLLPVDELH